MRLPTRRDDADVIRARLRALLAEPRPGGWLPEDDDGADAWRADGHQVSGAVGEPPPDDELPAGVGRHRAPGTAVRWDAGRTGARALWVAATVAVLLLLGWTWLDRPRVEPAGAASTVPAVPTSAPPSAEAAGTTDEAAAPSTVVVSVVGQVARPGLVTLTPGARVADAVAGAGGFLPEADPASVNLAAPVSDGEQISVGTPGAAAGAGGVGGPDAQGGGKVDLNTAGVADLDALPGIGPVLAQRIVEHRARSGGFRSVDELDDVPGIGPATAAELAELVTV
ncbi:ComEA family DNA-binding protein [Blastococcus montanus]|uniref:ComEA family DNA-binding protein n=1 Tax=Blastococcus montanus TaxID=3144973 RepID=UPI003208AE72